MYRMISPPAAENGNISEMNPSQTAETYFRGQIYEKDFSEQQNRCRYR